MLVQILLFDGFDEVDALGPYGVLLAAADAGAPLRAVLARLGSATVTSGHGLQLHVRAALDPEIPPAVLVVPGAGWLREAVPGSWADRERVRIAAAVAAVHRGGSVVAAVGTGATIVSAAGLLAGRRAAADPRAEAELRAHGADLVAERVVDDDVVVTSRGMASGIDLGLWLVERYASAELAARVAGEVGE